MGHLVTILFHLRDIQADWQVSFSANPNEFKGS
ncbi:hypothetical protein FAES_0710 [Fibrella aestuarina BUZ 2]|uniref:Uncharacterized protein n=1 Tax=Fibrella aestuarina BUZ 2 TaxID=1166018 RepID=I0K3L8_9BACT|nr:hypothetical protein FAES_0710 [Fibrella aestuarina BUZ 2]